MVLVTKQLTENSNSLNCKNNRITQCDRENIKRWQRQWTLQYTKRDTIFRNEEKAEPKHFREVFVF